MSVGPTHPEEKRAPGEPFVLSIVMPVYNEEATLEVIVERVFSAPVDMTIDLIAVDDGSKDASRDILARLAEKHPGLRVILHDKNGGKGAALATGFRAAQGDFVVIQDADLEYDPKDYPALLAPLVDGRADVVYGSRFLGGGGRAHLYLHYLGNRFLTTLSNLATNLNLTDMETCYKAFTREVAERLEIRSRSFAVEPEITAKVSKMKARVFEVPISYNGRDYSEGKKIGWKDAFEAVWAITRYGLFLRGVERLPSRK